MKKRRSRKKRKKNILPILAFCMMIIAPPFSWLVLSFMSYNNPTIMETLDYDIGEKRYKATLSETIDISTFTSEFEKFYNDRIPYRSILITKKNSLDTSIEAPYKDIEKKLLWLASGGQVKRVKSKAKVKTTDGYCYMDDAVDLYNGHGLYKNEIDPYVTGIKYPIKYLNSDVILGQSDWLFLNQFNIPYYTGEEQVPDGNYDEYIKPYETINRLCESCDKKFAVIICPEKEEIYNEYMPTMEIIDYVEKPLKIRDYIATNSDVKYIYPKEELIKYKPKYRTYMKYDSHWSNAGGYIASNIIKEELGIKTTPLRKWSIKKVPEIAKDLVSFGGADRNSYTDGIEYEIKYKPDTIVKEVYVIKSGPELELVQYESDAEDKRSLLIIGDSYRAALFNILSKDFAKVTHCAFNHMGSKKLDEAILDADIILFEAVERNEDKTLPFMCQRVYGVLSKE